MKYTSLQDRALMVNARLMPPANMAGTARKEGVERRAMPDSPWPLEWREKSRRSCM